MKCIEIEANNMLEERSWEIAIYMQEESGENVIYALRIDIIISRVV